MPAAYAYAGRGSRRGRIAAGVPAVAGILGTAVAPFFINSDLKVTSVKGVVTAVQGAGLVTALSAATTAVIGQPRIG